MLYQFAVGLTALVGLMVFWVLFQSWVRHNSENIPEDGDILKTGFGCYGCILAEKCAFTCEDKEQRHIVAKAHRSKGTI